MIDEGNGFAARCEATAMPRRNRALDFGLCPGSGSAPSGATY